MKIRLFIAIELGDEEKRALESLQERMKRQMPPLKWVRPGSIHLTIKFLGLIDKDNLPRIEEIVTAVAGGYRPFSVRFTGVGVFPNAHSPRVIWVGVGEGSDTICRMAEELDKLLIAELGLEAEKRSYSPHLTLARVKGRLGRGEINKVLPLFEDEEIGETVVGGIALIRSDLTPKGPIYTTLHRAKLT